MKKIRLLLVIGGMAVLSSGCFYTIHGVTNNPVGSKKGTVTVGLFQKDKDFSFSAAAKKGKVDKIGTWEIRMGFLKGSTTVTGTGAGESGGK